MAALTAAGISRDTAQWLAMNLVADAGAWRLRLDLDAIDALLADYFAQDLWSALESPRPGLALDVVVGGRSEVLSTADRARLDAASRAHPAVRVTTLPDAGALGARRRARRGHRGGAPGARRVITSRRRVASG